MSQKTPLEQLAVYLQNQIAEHDRSLKQYQQAMDGVRMRRDGLQAALDDLKKALATGTVQGVVVIPGLTADDIRKGLEARAKDLLRP